MTALFPVDSVICGGDFVSGVKPTDTEDGVRAGCRQRAGSLHPDTGGGAGDDGAPPDRSTSARMSAAVEVNPKGVERSVIECFCLLG